MFPQNVFMGFSWCMAFHHWSWDYSIWKYVPAPIHSFSYAWKSVVSWKTNFIHWDFTSILDPFENFLQPFLWKCPWIQVYNTKYSNLIHVSSITNIIQILVWINIGGTYRKGASALSHRVPKIQLNGMKWQININYKSYQEAVLESNLWCFQLFPRKKRNLMSNLRSKLVHGALG